MKTLAEAVKACNGVWPVDGNSNGERILRGWFGSDKKDPDIIILNDESDTYSRSQFEAEARRQGYVEGFEGHPDDVAFKGEWLPEAGRECEMLWTSPDIYYRVRVIGHDDGEVIGRWMEGPEEGMIFNEKQESFPGHDNFRPLKSDRERWIIEAQKHCVEYGDNNIGRIYDALISGELPTPEAK